MDSKLNTDAESNEGRSYNTFPMEVESPKGGDESKFYKWIKSQSGIPNAPVVDAVFYVVIVLLMWCFLLSIFGEQALPMKNVFEILLLLVLANVAGILFRTVKLPGLLGMLLVGITMRSLGFYNVSGPYAEIGPIAREVALAVILIKAGLALDPEILKKKAFTVLKLSLLPCIGEAILAAIAGHFIIGLPWLWGALLGLALSPISPAVVVPSLIALKERGFGEDKGIATLVIAASAVDDIFAIVGFDVVLVLIFSAGRGLAMTIIYGFLDVIGGIVVGLLWALFCAFVPNKSDSQVTAKRSALIGVGAVAVVLGSTSLHHGAIGTLGSITAALFANISWTVIGFTNGNQDSVPHVFSVVWKFTEPVLFAMVGAEIDVNVLSPTMVLYAIAVIGVGIAGRVIVCFCALYGTGLNFKEVTFVMFAWIPKATVQAAISGKALDLVRAQEDPSEYSVELAKWILNTAIISIILTAPVGSIAISLLGDRLLTKKTR